MTNQDDCGRLTLDGHLAPTCGCFEAGYAAGKDKAWFELATWVPGEHNPGCEYRPCIFARRILGDARAHVAPDARR